MNSIKPSENQFAALESDLVKLFASLIPAICEDYRASEDPDEETPGMSVTVGASVDDDGNLSWSYQTGDNSYSGGAYLHPHWGVISLFRDSKPAVVASDCVSQISDAIFN